MKLEIDANVAQAILNYLQTKPFSEVHVLIGGLVKLVPPKAVETEKAEESK